MPKNNVPFFVLAGIGAAIAIAACVTSAVTARSVQASDKDAVLASSALTGFGTIVLLFALILLYASQKQTLKANNGLKIAGMVMCGIYVLMILIGSIISGVIGNKPENAGQKNALIAAAVLPVFSLIFFVIAAIVGMKQRDLITLPAGRIAINLR
jgi:hypothetical protein